MAIRHGNKTYFQILLDPHKAELVKFLAKAKGCLLYTSPSPRDS